jgi:hypothetical protein
MKIYLTIGVLLGVIVSLIGCNTQSPISPSQEMQTLGAVSQFIPMGSTSVVTVKDPNSGRLVCFAIGQDSGIYYRAELPDGSWSTSWNSTLKQIGFSAHECISTGIKDGNIYVFTKMNSGDNIYYRYLTNTGWNFSWIALPSASGGSPIKVFNVNNRLLVLSSMGCVLRSIYQNADGTFPSSWTQVPIPVFLNPNEGFLNNSKNFAGCFTYGGDIAVFIENTLGEIYSCRFIASSGTWSQSYPSISPITVGSGEMAAEMNQDTRAEVFVIKPDNTLWHCWENGINSRSFSYWAQLSSACYNNISTGINLDKRIELFYRGPNNYLQHQYQNTTNGVWNTPQSFENGSIVADPNHIGVGNCQNGRLAVFAKNGSAIYWASQHCVNCYWDPFSAFSTSIQ